MGVVSPIFNTTPNQFFLRIINPYDPVMWDFQLVFQPDTPIKEVEYPDYTIDDFVKTNAVEFLGYIEEGKTLNPLFNVLTEIATSVVNYEILGEDDATWKHLVSLYIAHHLEMAMARLKNQADEISMTPEKAKDKKISYTFGEHIGTEYEQTKYGFAFWSMYKNFLRFRFWGVYTPRGYNR
jgi:hypothetical protein